MNSRKDKQILGFYPLRRLGKDHGRSHSGFTLLEVMVTVAIIGVLVGLAIGGIQNLLPKFRLNAAARQIRGDMQRCKMVAVRNGTECLMVFVKGNSTGNAGSYTACISDDSSCSGDPIIFSKNLNGDDFIGVWLNDADFFPSHLGKLAFNSRGLPNDGNGNGFVEVKNDKDVRKVDISKTGRTSID